jgi:hypothetical protein
VSKFVVTKKQNLNNDCKDHLHYIGGI